jgi:hypothetical protein
MGNRNGMLSALAVGLLDNLSVVDSTACSSLTSTGPFEDNSTFGTASVLDPSTATVARSLRDRPAKYDAPLQPTSKRTVAARASQWDAGRG